MPQMTALGTSESFMHHPANDRCWPEIASCGEFVSGSFGEFPKRPRGASQGLYWLDFGLLCHLQSVFDLDAQVSDGTFHLCVTQ